jgi:hypothetical protein
VQAKKWKKHQWNNQLRLIPQVWTQPVLNKFFLIVLIIICIIPVCCTSGDYSFKEKPRPVYKANKKIIEQVQEGDILLRQGIGPMSTQIVNVMNEKHHFSHCAIVCRINDTLKVVHSISPQLSETNGVQTQNLYDFFCDVADSNIAIVRPKMNDMQKLKFASEARRYLAKQIHFDHAFDFDDTTNFSCSELVYYSYKNSVNTNPFLFKIHGNSKLLKFDSFFNPEYFTVVWSAKKLK